MVNSAGRKPQSVTVMWMFCHCSHRDLPLSKHLVATGEFHDICCDMWQPVKQYPQVRLSLVTWDLWKHTKKTCFLNNVKVKSILHVHVMYSNIQYTGWFMNKWNQTSCMFCSRNESFCLQKFNVEPEELLYMMSLSDGTKLSGLSADYFWPDASK